MWLVWKPTQTSLEKRRKYIANEIAESEQAKREMFMKLQQAEHTRLKAQMDAKIIVENATSQAHVVKEAIEGEGKINAKKIVDDAQQHIVRLKEQLKSQSEKEVLDIAFNVSEALLQIKMTKKDNERMIKNFIKKMSNKKVSSKGKSNA